PVHPGAGLRLGLCEGELNEVGEGLEDRLQLRQDLLLIVGRVRVKRLPRDGLETSTAEIEVDPLRRHAGGGVRRRARGGWGAGRAEGRGGGIADDRVVGGAADDAGDSLLT